MWASPRRHPTFPAAAAFLLNRCDNAGGRALNQLKSSEELTPEELADQDLKELLEREPANAAAALSVLGDDSTVGRRRGAMGRDPES
jgi:hypothetical protein